MHGRYAGLAMNRTYFNVCPTADGSWNVGIGSQSPVNFIDKGDAIGAAIEAARTQWAQYGMRTGVRIRLASGEWREECTFGGGLQHRADATRSARGN